jgi:hypothetical protein
MNFLGSKPRAVLWACASGDFYGSDKSEVPNGVTTCHLLDSFVDFAVLIPERPSLRSGKR